MKSHQFKAIHRKHNYFFGFSICAHFCMGKTPRLGISVPKKFGSAVSRNAFKRRVREAFRIMQYELLPLEIIITPKKGQNEFTVKQIKEDLRNLCASQRRAETSSRNK